MSDRGAEELTTAERIARLHGIRNYLEDQEYGYLDLTGVYGSDPMAESPYVVQGTFIPEEIGGIVTVVDADDEAGATLARENLNQMLNNFLPGGYKQRWGNFDLWRGAWDHESEHGHADVGPMFGWQDSFPLTDLLGDVSEVAYADLSFDPENAPPLWLAQVLFKSVYFSVVTFATLGYGDIQPIGLIARLLAGLEALLGALLAALLVFVLSRIVTW